MLPLCANKIIKHETKINNGKEALDQAHLWMKSKKLLNWKSNKDSQMWHL